MGTFSHWFCKLKSSHLYHYLNPLKLPLAQIQIFFFLSTMLNKSKLCNEKSKPKIVIKPEVQAIFP